MQTKHNPDKNQLTNQTKMLKTKIQHSQPDNVMKKS